MKFEGHTWMGVAGLGAIMLLPSCNTPSFRAVSVRPIYGWADGCNSVKISGAGFEDDVSVSVGDDPLMSLATPEAEIDQGYYVTGVIPPLDLAASEYVTITVSSGGESDDVLDDFYRIACPAPILVEGMSPTTGLAAGGDVTIGGCHIYDTHTVSIGGESATISNVSSCEGGTDTGSFAAPDVADGFWHVAYYDSTGAEIYPVIEGCDPAAAPQVYATDVDPENGPFAGDYILDEEGNPLDPCYGATLVQYGGEG